MRSVLASAVALSSIIAGAALGVTPMIPEANAQQAESDLIRRVIVQGNERIEARTVESYLLLEPGQPFDPSRVDLSLKTLFETGLFADVVIARDGDNLVVQVVENPIINQVIFEGNNANDDEKLSEEIQAAPRGVFTAARVQADVQRILEVYRRSGRFSVNVTPHYVPLSQNRVDLIFEITEGPVTGVRSINFIGNDVYSDRRLRSEIVTRQSRLWRFFSSNDNYDPDRLEYDRELLRQFYANQGYADFQVVSAVAELTPDQEDFYITFTIDEGEQYNFGEITVETALDKLNSDSLEAIIPIQEGTLFRGDMIEDTVDSLTFAAGIAGYAFVDVRPRIDRDPETKTVNITFAIDEGPRVYIERINIVGNTRTLDRVIRREMRISEGDAFNRVLLDQSRNRIRRLGFFEDVEIEETPGSLPDRTEVDVRVSEGPTGEVSFAAGFSSVDSFLLDLNFTERNWRGRGQFVSASLQTSSRQQTLDFRFTEPRFLDRDLVAGVDLFSTRTDFLDIADYETQTIGASGRIGFPLTDRANISLRYTLRQDDVQIRDRNIVIDENGNIVRDPAYTYYVVSVDPVEANVPDGGAIVDQCDIANVDRSSLCRQEREDLASIVGYSFSWDRRNDPIRPTRGFDLGFSQELAGLGGDVFYLKTEGVATFYRGIWRDLIASFRLSGGYVSSYNDDDLRINNRFFRGGNSFRGFDVAGLGPRDVIITTDLDGNVEEVRRASNQSSLGGKMYAVGTLELAVPNFLPEEYGIRTSLFTEFGTVGLLDEEDRTPEQTYEITDSNGNVTGYQILRTEDEASLRAAAGISIFWDSPFGPIRFDFSQILAKEDYDRTETFRFSTSTQF
ncbi:outer membrane protein assembly factor BamA [Ponticaulis sp.]|uniref:outer membrane protein assembly factor BamA n=1 Tax=Ponticaulis sp. TaxID=2020902 RepID=UPI000B6989C9|nr:outer membrane protein assembly factor BamA [Ponticaulis sp.]MAI89437.1 outer membrane protein assembly factor BamA [Ponticaulis sp.]OUY00475.1 MAG: outer membrane protein assembly factor BamA [Hyphomonadaceae bacterium TMED5]|tara:strand:- start:84084 stop:86627 length:2544 start_codon:yes stop_codon:yes gene_type:complete